MAKSFYITTAIDYPNGKPHIGHAYEKIVTDAYARWFRLLKRDVYFLTGTDENGQKLVKAAEAEGLETKTFVDQQVDQFRSLCKKLEISNDDFIRTTEKRHIDVVHELWKRLADRDQVYFGQYEGSYCLNCEAFYTELQAPDGVCPHHNTELEKVKEDGYFFKLGEHADWIQSHIEKNPQFIRPERARKEILQRIAKEPVKDLSISRPNTGWGIPVPDNSEHVIYTWFDALINYLSAVKTDPLFDRFWPANMHVIGKDIVWFHSVIWPCMLKAAELPLPEQIYVHGMLLGPDGRKMSKSSGNVVDPKDVFDQYPLDSCRYYILRAIPSGMDGAFIVEDLVNRHNNELANDFGNLLMRVTKLTKKKMGDLVSSQDVEQEFSFDGVLEKMSEQMEQRDHHKALDTLWSKIQELNLYVTKKEPWRMEPESQDFRTCVYNALFGLQCISILIGPFLPQISSLSLEILGAPQADLDSLQKFGGADFQLGEPKMLFPKIEMEPV